MFCFVIVAFAELLISQVPCCNRAGAPLCHRCTSREQSMWDFICMIYVHCSAPCWAIFYLCGTTGTSQRVFFHHGRSMLSGGFYGMIQLKTLSTMTIGKMQFVQTQVLNGGWVSVGYHVKLVKYSHCRPGPQVGYLSRLPVACIRNVAQESNIKHIAAGICWLGTRFDQYGRFFLPLKREGKIKNGVLPNTALKDEFTTPTCIHIPSTHQPQDLPFKFSKWRGFCRDIF